MEKRLTGKTGESLVCRHYLKNGYTILDTNYRCRFGEIDIVAKKDDTIVFMGDYIDRGLKSREVVDKIIDMQNVCKCVYLIGLSYQAVCFREVSILMVHFPSNRNLLFSVEISFSFKASANTRLMKVAIWMPVLENW